MTGSKKIMIPGFILGVVLTYLLLSSYSILGEMTASTIIWKKNEYNNNYYFKNFFNH